jgi:hypothetical protein
MRPNKLRVFAVIEVDNDNGSTIVLSRLMKYGKFGFHEHYRKRLFYQPGAEQKFNLGQIAHPFSLEWVLAATYVTTRWVKNELRSNKCSIRR